MKKAILFLLVSSIIASGSVTVSASRKRDMENSVAAEETTPSVEIDYGDHEFVENLPGKKKDNIYSGYKYDGVEINIPDFSRFQDFEAEQITNLSDAIVDYMGWDTLLGTSDWMDNEGCFYFKQIPGLSSAPNTVFGYSRKKFGCEEYKFKAKVKNDSGEIGGKWLGIQFLSSTTQSYTWGGNPGYLICVKENVIELQEWFNSQIMLGTWDCNALKYDTWQEYCLTVNDLGEGFEIILTIDGQEVINYQDTEGPHGPKEGYFNIYGNFNETYLAPIEGAATISQSGIKQEVTTQPEDNTDVENVEITELTLNGSKLTSNIGEKEIPAVYFENTTAMLPLRAVSQVLGGLVSWNGEKKAATVVKNGVSVTVTDTFDEYTLNGKYYKAAQKVVNHDGTLYAPAEIFAKLFNMKLSQNGEEVKLSVK